MLDYWSPSERPLADYHREALALKNTLLTGVASGIDPEFTPTWTCSLPLVRTLTNHTGMSKALSDKPCKPSKQLCNFILPCPWCMFLKEITLRTSAPGFPPPVFACCLHVFGKKSRTAGALIPSILIALDSKAPIAAQGCRLIYFSLCPTKGSVGVIVFSQTFHRLDNS